MGLRDQLLKAGLVSKKQVQKADGSKKKLEHEAHKCAQVAQRLAEEKSEATEAVAAEAERKREEDRRRNLEIEAQRQEKERSHRVRQLLKSNDLFDNNAETPYYFTEDNTHIRCFLVTAFQREMLARGKIGIVRTDETGVDAREFVLVPAHTVRTVRSLLPERFTLMHSSVEDWQDLEEILKKEIEQSAV